MLEKLSNDYLLEAYKKATELNLDKDFILLLEKELLKREIKYAK